MTRAWKWSLGSLAAAFAAIAPDVVIYNAVYETWYKEISIASRAKTILDLQVIFRHSGAATRREGATIWNPSTATRFSK